MDSKKTGLNNTKLSTTLEGVYVPCDHCPYREKCATGYACMRFLRFIDRGRESQKYSRIPDREVYQLIFNG